MYLSHACVSFTYNWYYLHLMRVSSLPLSLSPFSLSHTFSSLFWSHSTGCHRPGPSCPCPLLYPFWDHVMWASTASCDDDHVDNLGAGEAVAFDRALCACRFSGFSESSMGEGGGGGRGSCAFENLFVLHGVPFPILPILPTLPTLAYPTLPYPFPNNMHSLIMFIGFDCCHTLIFSFSPCLFLSFSVCLLFFSCLFSFLQFLFRLFPRLFSFNPFSLLFVFLSL